MKIGNINIEGKACLAPMAGVADKAVRCVCRERGAAFTVGEMTSAKGIIMASSKSFDLLKPDKEGINAVQLFANNPDDMYKAVLEAVKLEPSFIDINMGCPAPKITNNGSGSALLKNPQLCGRIMAAAKKASGNIPVTAKIRRGFNNGDNVAAKVAKILEDNGADALTIHARTREQMYAPPIDINCITEVKNAVNIPVIGNGDVFTAQDAENMLKVTGCDMVMIGRGALGNPWIFEEVNCLLSGKEAPKKPTLEEKMQIMLREIEILVEDKGEITGFKEARKHVSWYMTGLKQAASLRGLCGSIASMEDVLYIASKALEANCEERQEK